MIIVIDLDTEGSDKLLLLSVHCETAKGNLIRSSHWHYHGYIGKLGLFS